MIDTVIFANVGSPNYGFGACESTDRNGGITSKDTLELISRLCGGLIYDLGAGMVFVRVAQNAEFDLENPRAQEESRRGARGTLVVIK